MIKALDVVFPPTSRLASGYGKTRQTRCAPGLAWTNKRLNGFILTRPDANDMGYAFRTVSQSDYPRPPTRSKIHQVKQLNYRSRIDFWPTVRPRARECINQ